MTMKLPNDNKSLISLSPSELNSISGGNEHFAYDIGRALRFIYQSASPVGQVKAICDWYMGGLLRNY